MRWTRTLGHRVRSLLRARQVDAELDEELHFHLEHLIEEHVARGLSPAEARHAALREMGGVEQRREECRDARGWRWLEELGTDLRIAWRRLRRSPFFTAVAVASLALGIGVNTAVFSAVNALRLKPLPYPNADRLVQIDHADAPGWGVLDIHLADWTRHSRTLETIAGYSDAGEVRLEGVGEPVVVRAHWASPGLFSLLGASMWLGRDFQPEDHARGHVMPVILDHGLWQRRFGSDPDVIGRSIRLSGAVVPVIGVLPPDFRLAGQPDVWGPMRSPDIETMREADEHGNLEAIGLRRADVTPEQVAAELMAIKRAHEDVRHNANDPVRVLPLRERLSGDSRRLLLLLTAAVALILLIACANVANLMLARATALKKDRAVLAALGGGRFRLLRQMLAEGLLLSTAGGLAGLALAATGTRLVLAQSPPDTFGPIAGIATVAVDGHVLAFTLVASLLTGILFGVAPGLTLSGSALSPALHEDRRSALVTRSRVRQGLLVLQVALALVLVVGAGLLVRSFTRLLEVDPGFRTDHRLTVDVELDGRRYDEAARRIEFWERLLARVDAMPGVEHAGATLGLPLAGCAQHFVMPLDPNAERTVRGCNSTVTLDYFRAAGIALRAGRFFDATDGREARSVVIVSRSLARALFGTEDVVGKDRVFPGGQFATVVGVVDDVRYGLAEDVQPMFYRPYAQDPTNRATLVVHSRVPPGELASRLREEVRALDPGLASGEAKTMDQRAVESLGVRRFVLAIVGTLAVLALVLAGVGVWGVIAYAVVQRTPEIGVRVALGATPSAVVALFVRHALAVAALGIVIGLAAAAAVTRTMHGWIFGITATDPLTFALASGVLAAAVLIASSLPAWRAARISPVAALRHE